MASEFTEAMLNDPEYAAEMAKQPEPTEKWAPRMSEWDLPAQQGAKIIDLLQALIGATINTAGGKASPVEPEARPRTALDDARKARERQETGAFLEQLGYTEGDY